MWRRRRDFLRADKDGYRGPPHEAARAAHPGGKIFAKMKTFGRLFAIVGIAASSELMEARRWHMALARVMGKLARMARLPEIMAFSQLHDMPVLQVRDLIEYMEH